MNPKPRFPFSYDAVFCKVLEENPEIAKKIFLLAAKKELEVIDLDYMTVQKQKVFDPSMDNKSIRLDVYMWAPRFFADAEMQNDKDEIPLRSRYYLSVHDVDRLPKGSSYKEVPKALILFICTFDPFKSGLAKYIAKERLFEDEVCIKDITEKNNYDANYVKIFLNTEYKKKNVEEELANLLDYVKTEKPTDALTKEIEEKVEEVNQKDWEYFMTLQDKLNLNGERKLAEGKAIGRKEVRNEGLQALVSSLRPFMSNVEEMYETVVSNEAYKDVSFETIQKLFEKK